MTPPELRQDPFTHDWVAITPGRAHRPPQMAPPHPPTGPPPQPPGPQPAPHPATAPPRQPAAADPACPFCPGHEDATPPEIWRLPAPTRASGTDWAIRVIPNRYPVLSSGDQPARHHTTGLHTHANGIGSHEVVIESPLHDWDLPDGDETAVTNVLRAYRLPTPMAT